MTIFFTLKSSSAVHVNDHLVSSLSMKSNLSAKILVFFLVGWGDLLWMFTVLEITQNKEYMLGYYLAVDAAL